MWMEEEKAPCSRRMASSCVCQLTAVRLYPIRWKTPFAISNAASASFERHSLVLTIASSLQCFDDVMKTENGVQSAQKSTRTWSKIHRKSWRYRYKLNNCKCLRMITSSQSKFYNMIRLTDTFLIEETATHAVIMWEPNAMRITVHPIPTLAVRNGTPCRHLLPAAPDAEY